MSVIVEKDKKYLKGLYTKGSKELTEQFGDAITEDRIMLLALAKVGKQYGMTQSDVDKLVSGNDEDDFDFEDEDLLESDESKLTIYDDIDDVPAPVVSGSSSWDDLMARTPDPMAKAKENSKYEKNPSMIIELGPTYYLKVDLTELPFTKEFEGTYGPYTKTAVKVFLQKVSDEDAYEMKYTKGDFAGELAYVNGDRYTLWMDEKCMGFFKLFWFKHRGVPTPDNRIFTFKHTKKGKFNVWLFGLPK